MIASFQEWVIDIRANAALFASTYNADTLSQPMPMHIKSL